MRKLPATAALSLALVGGLALSVALLAAGPAAPAQPAVAGVYHAHGDVDCLGDGGRLAVRQSGRFLSFRGDARGGRGTIDGARITGHVECRRGGPAPLKGRISDGALHATLGRDRLTAAIARDPPRDDRGDGPAPAPAFLAALTVIMIVARLGGTLAVQLRQPRVIGEVLAGITLGPTLLGQLAPDLHAAVFPPEVLPGLTLVANLGVVLFMFLIGLELDAGQLRRSLGQAATISYTSLVFPLTLGLLLAVPLYPLLAPQTPFVAFALFMGVAMSITAFPVLARILAERRMLGHPVGVLALACAAFDDVTAWCLIALATAAAHAGSPADAVQTFVLAIGFCAALALLARPLLARAAAVHDARGGLPDGWVVAVLAGALGAAWISEHIGIAVIFGAFAFGLAVPRHAGVRAAVSRPIKDVAALMLLPIFFVTTGLRTDVGLLDRSALYGLTALIITIAVVGKLGGAAVAARVTGHDLRTSAVIGTLMNTRGLTELIVLNLALEAGVLSDALFTALVLMTLVTTCMAGPLLNVLGHVESTNEGVQDEEVPRGRRSRGRWRPGRRHDGRAVVQGGA